MNAHAALTLSARQSAQTKAVRLEFGETLTLFPPMQDLCFPHTEQVCVIAPLAVEFMRDVAARYWAILFGVKIIAHPCRIQPCAAVVRAFRRAQQALLGTPFQLDPTHADG